MPTPIQQHRSLRASLQVVLLPQDYLQRERPPSAQGPDEQHRVPRAERARGAQKRRQQLRVLADRREECKAGEAARERKRQTEHFFGVHLVRVSLYQKWVSRSSRV